MIGGRENEENFLKIFFLLPGSQSNFYLEQNLKKSPDTFPFDQPIGQGGDPGNFLSSQSPVDQGNNC